MACLQGLDDVMVVSIHSSGDLGDRRGARELTLESTACARNAQGELLEISPGANAPSTVNWIARVGEAFEERAVSLRSGPIWTGIAGGSGQPRPSARPYGLRPAAVKSTDGWWS
jgi:hypothetical protein